MKKENTLDILSNKDMNGIYSGLTGLGEMSSLDRSFIETLGITPLLPELVQKVYEIEIELKRTKLQHLSCLSVNYIKQFAKEQGVRLKKDNGNINLNDYIHYSKRGKSLLKYLEGKDINRGDIKPYNPIEKEIDNIFFGAYGHGN